MTNEAVNLAFDKIRPYLYDYLVEKKFIGDGLPLGTPFVCPNPNHEDNSPSATIMPSGVKAYCHGCSATFDIFTLHSWLDNAPTSGIGYLTGNVIPLAEKYDVEFELGELSEEERFKIDAYRAFRIASDYITSQLWSDDLVEYLTDRGLTVQQAQGLGIGVVTNYTHFYEILKTNFTHSFLRDTGFTKEGMFSPTSIIFTVKDSSGTPIGFISRDIEWAKKFEIWSIDKKGAPPRKYDSTPEKSRVYKKREVLFGLNLVLNEAHNSILIVEGQFDWAVLRANGITNVVALSGSALTPDHLTLLRKHKIYNIILCLDGDNAGSSTVSKLLLGSKDEPGMLASSSVFRVKVIDLPNGFDPADYVLQNGANAFKDLNRTDSFDWALRFHEESSDPLEVCEKMIPFILAEQNLIRRDQMEEILSSSLGLSKQAITDEVYRRENEAAALIAKEEKAIAEECIRNLQFANTDLRQVLNLALNQLEGVQRLGREDALSIEETLSALEDQEDAEASLLGPEGFRFFSLRSLEEDLNGEKEGIWAAIGGVANTGKTGIMAQIARELVECNEDAIVLVHTIDDTRSQFNRRLLVQYAREWAEDRGLLLADLITLNMIANPRYWLDRRSKELEGLLDARAYAYEQLRKVISDGRLHIKDSSHGASLSVLEQLLKKVNKSRSDRSIAVVLDNFHDLKDFVESNSEAVRFKKISGYLKHNIAQHYKCTVFSTVQYKKIESGKRPVDSDIKESGAMEYDTNFIMHLYSQLKASEDQGQKTDVYHTSPVSDRIKLPIIEANVTKNKITSEKGVRYYAFFPAQSRYEFLSYQDYDAILASNISTEETVSEETRGEVRGNKYFPKKSTPVATNSFSEIPF